MFTSHGGKRSPPKTKKKKKKKKKKKRKKKKKKKKEKIMPYLGAEESRFKKKEGYYQSHLRARQ